MKSISRRFVWSENLYWIISLLLLLLLFLIQGSPFIQIFYFTTFLMPVIIGTSYVFNQILLPRFLLKAQYWKFALYLTYLIIISLYLVALVVFLAIVIFTYFQFDQQQVLRINLVALSLGMYCIVFVNAFIKVFKAFQKNEIELAELEEIQIKNQTSSIVVRSNRKQVQIFLNELFYIESLGDYVQFQTQSDKIISKEKISHLLERLPDNFVRIHRSFIVNKNEVEAFTNDKVVINGIELPISRTYKKKALEALNSI